MTPMPKGEENTHHSTLFGSKGDIIEHLSMAELMSMPVIYLCNEFTKRSTFRGRIIRQTESFRFFGNIHTLVHATYHC